MWGNSSEPRFSCLWVLCTYRGNLNQVIHKADDLSPTIFLTLKSPLFSRSRFVVNEIKFSPWILPSCVLNIGRGVGRPRPPNVAVAHWSCAPAPGRHGYSGGLLLPGLFQSYSLLSRTSNSRAVSVLSRGGWLCVYAYPSPPSLRGRPPRCQRRRSVGVARVKTPGTLSSSPSILPGDTSP